ncbi:MAG TPA: hypothetical protein H9790_05360 [Candidatus Agathobaculum intestinipullorum]|nr:hypothetical protein [Candidatus Agathobaculum intestinipullorum]
MEEEYAEQRVFALFPPVCCSEMPHGVSDFLFSASTGPEAPAFGAIFIIQAQPGFFVR